MVFIKHFDCVSQQRQVKRCATKVIPHVTCQSTDWASRADRNCADPMTAINSPSIYTRALCGGIVSSMYTDSNHTCPQSNAWSSPVKELEPTLCENRTCNLVAVRNTL